MRDLQKSMMKNVSWNLKKFHWNAIVSCITVNENTQDNCYFTDIIEVFWTKPIYIGAVMTALNSICLFFCANIMFLLLFLIVGNVFSLSWMNINLLISIGSVSDLFLFFVGETSVFTLGICILLTKVDTLVTVCFFLEHLLLMTNLLIGIELFCCCCILLGA